MSALDRVITCCPQCAGIGTGILWVTGLPKRLDKYYVECGACGYCTSQAFTRRDQEVEPGMAKEVFEMRTFKEIKDALDLCISEDKPCTTCAYNKFRASKSCMDMMLNDARNCIANRNQRR